MPGGQDRCRRAPLPLGVAFRQGSNFKRLGGLALTALRCSLPVKVDRFLAAATSDALHDLRFLAPGERMGFS